MYVHLYSKDKLKGGDVYAQESERKKVYLVQHTAHIGEFPYPSDGLWQMRYI